MGALRRPPWKRWVLRRPWNQSRREASRRDEETQDKV
jgi:hypothetical protein